MRKPELDQEQRGQAARLTALLDGIDVADPGLTPGALREISGDRVVLGDVLGDYLHRVVAGTQAETASYWPVLELLRAAGADEQRAAAKASWLARPSDPPISGD